MNNHISISAAEFERQKNLRASLITAAIIISLFLILIWMKMTIPQPELPIVEEYIEVNLGSGDQGFGSDQPQLPGDPAPAAQEAYTPPQPVQSRIRQAPGQPPGCAPANSAPTVKACRR